MDKKIYAVWLQIACAITVVRYDLFIVTMYLREYYFIPTRFFHTECSFVF
jgi:hypothetical protein